jgi:hypothetical protein
MCGFESRWVLLTFGSGTWTSLEWSRASEARERWFKSSRPDSSEPRPSGSARNECGVVQMVGRHPVKVQGVGSTPTAAACFACVSRTLVPASAKRKRARLGDRLTVGPLALNQKMEVRVLLPELLCPWRIGRAKLPLSYRPAQKNQARPEPRSPDGILVPVEESGVLAALSRRRTRVQIPSGTLVDCMRHPDGETEHHLSLRTRSSGFDSWSGYWRCSWIVIRHSFHQSTIHDPRFTISGRATRSVTGAGC